MTGNFRFGLVALALMAVAPRPALAYDDRRQVELPWPFGYHEYGFDVTRPGSTADRPYWHGDDAVPLGLRWRDQGWEGSPVDVRPDQDRSQPPE